MRMAIYEGRLNVEGNIQDVMQCEMRVDISHVRYKKRGTESYKFPGLCGGRQIPPNVYI